MKFPIEIRWAMGCCLKHDGPIVLPCGAKNLTILLLLVILLILRRGGVQFLRRGSVWFLRRVNFLENLDHFLRNLGLRTGVSLPLGRPSPRSLHLRRRRISFLRNLVYFLGNLDLRRAVSLQGRAVMQSDDEGLLRGVILLHLRNLVSSVDDFPPIGRLLPCQLQF